MKRNSLSSTGRVMDEWECENLIFGGDQSSAFPWPQRNYICSYCKRVFNSAQALGGHMNVHRRDRARLRQLPSWGFESPKPNPNVSSPMSSALLSTKFSPCHCADKVSLLSPSAFCSTSYREKKVVSEFPHFGCGSSSSESADLSKEKSMKAVVNEASGGLKSEGQNRGLEVLKKDEVMSLDLEMWCKDSREVLDLELRLGYNMN